MKEFEIKNRWSGETLYSAEGETLKEVVARAVGERAYLSGAYLRGADLSGAYLSGADLSGAYLRGAYLRGADLSGADLSGAYLRGAYLRGAYLSGAYLRGAYLRGAYLSGARGLNPFRVQPLLMLLEQPGLIRAYKLVTGDYESPLAAQSGAKPITYKIGNTYSVKDANTDVTEDCGAGLHVATLDWVLKNYSEGNRVLVVEFTAADIACIPTMGEGKFRVRRLTVVAEKTAEELGLVAEREEAEKAAAERAEKASAAK